MACITGAGGSVGGYVVSTGGWYPHVICHAVALVDDLAVFRALPDSYSQVLRRLIKKVGKDDGQRAILARRQTIAEEAGKSVETVYRALREFESRGWIEQRDRRPGEHLIGSESEITFSRDLCDLLDLPYEGKVVSRSAGKSAVRGQPSVSDDRSYNAISFSSIQPSSKEHPEEFAEKSQNLSTAQQVASDSGKVQMQGRSVPTELVWLVAEQELSLSGLFALMRNARNNGKLLSDVVACTKQYLAKLNGRALFAYLNTLTKADRDFAWEVKAKVEQVEVAKTKRDDGQKLQAAAAKLQGRWFRSQASGSVFEVDKGWIRMWLLDGGRVREGSKLLEMAFVDAVEKKILVGCEVGAEPLRVDEGFAAK